MKDIAIATFCLLVIAFVSISAGKSVRDDYLDMQPYETTGQVLKSDKTMIQDTEYQHVVVRTADDVVILNLSERLYYLANIPKVGMTCKVISTPIYQIFYATYYIELRDCE